MKIRVFYVLLLTGSCLLLSGCIAGSPQTIHPADYTETIRVACIGDSITFGAGIPDRENHHYPLQLGNLLGEKWQTRNFGVSGATLLRNGDLPYWDQQAYQQTLLYNPHVVIIKLGTNDTKPQNWKYSDEFIRDYKDLIKRLSALPAHPKIWICLPVPAYEERWGISDEVVREDVIPKIRQIAKDMGVGLIDLYTPMSDKPELFPDRIHPNAEGARQMAVEIYKAITGTEPTAHFPINTLLAS
ncbi:MAG: hypothetical protein JW828_09755 [Sedimentisphaerales bacterium]|nr:hypothetical protein [Sedimentisphaerales bacterium]